MGTIIISTILEKFDSNFVKEICEGYALQLG